MAGPDEDAFTRTVGAVERLLETRSTPREVAVRKLHLVGAPEEFAEDALPSALGMESLAVRRYAASPDGASAAIESAGHPTEGEGVDVIVGLDAPSSEERRSGSATVGLLVEAREGLRLEGHLRVPGRHGSAPAAALVLARSASMIDELPRRPASIWLEFPGEVPAEWTDLWVARAAPGGWRSFAPAGDLGKDAATGLLSLVHQARQEWPNGTEGIVGVVEPTGATLLKLRESASDRSGAPPPEDVPGALIELPTGDVRWPVRLDAVSEGAYVPRASYLESLPARWRLLGATCGVCRAVTFPPRSRCRNCGRTDQLQPTELPRRGCTVAAVTTIAPGAQPTEFDPQVALLGAYSVVIVEVVPGVRVTAQVTDAIAGTIALGDRVDLELRRLYAMEGAWRYGLKAVPTDAVTRSAPARG
ncbi:MAG: zinc ribbon domain-containing protein [Thermoplasmata archaeon]|nr:zinc ribbon domain-containing protein [Thermoplasmata archaeon]MCI4344352.1 zinc ribbon domain-containing protein [Thermoplasmata archaeon]